MGRGIKWLVGALGISVLVLLALKGICSSPRDFPSLTKFFCPQRGAVAGPRLPLRAPARRP
ncbi:MAG TPA: hypothetical protein DDZ83_07675 [Nitrospinae bacterium]|nr:hypothetical protein [Nitrospinota bacterium]